MKIHVCCPDAGCGTFQDFMRFLRKYGIEPGLGVDEEGNHYAEFDPATDDLFLEKLYCQSKGGVLCYCGHWWEPIDDQAIKIRCNDCLRSFTFCLTCGPDRLIGCPYCMTGVDDENNPS